LGSSRAPRRSDAFLQISQRRDPRYPHAQRRCDQAGN
jgi:hypothetical protein